MGINFRKIRPVAGSAAISFLLITGCQSPPTAIGVSSAMVNKVVLPSYENLVAKSSSFNRSLTKLVNNPTAGNLKSAQKQWRQARKSWEITETWAYGPAETLDFDPNLDDWPVSKLELSSALGANSKFTSNTFSRLDTTSKGFHGIEYVLFSKDNASNLSENELAYLRIAGQDLEDNSIGLLNAWNGPKGFGVTGVEANPEAAIKDILAGMEGCLAEVADGKLGGAFDSSDEGELESVFSGNTGTDVVFNISGVKKAWEDSQVKAYVTRSNSDLAEKLSNHIDKSLILAQSLPARLNDKLGDQSIQEKVTALREVLTEAAETTVAIAESI